MDLVQPRQLLATASVVGLALILVAARQDYNVYLSYGPGGLPYNIQGWLISNMMRLYSKDPFSTSQPLWPAQKDETLSFLSQPFPKRSGGRPKVGPHPIPQRQLEQLGPPNMKQKMEAEFEALALRARDQGLVEVKKSGYERHFDAMFVATGRERNDTAKQTNGEITHIHRGIDGSVHVVLAAADSKMVIENGWGQHHGLSGVHKKGQLLGRRAIPSTYTFLYSPRNDEEIDVLLRIIKASIQFMTDYRGEI